MQMHPETSDKPIVAHKSVSLSDLSSLTPDELRDYLWFEFLGPVGAPHRLAFGCVGRDELEVAHAAVEAAPEHEPHPPEVARMGCAVAKLTPRRELRERLAVCTLCPQGSGVVRTWSSWSTGYWLPLLERQPPAGQLVIADKGFAGADFERAVRALRALLLRPSRADEPERPSPPSGRIRQRIESIVNSLKDWDS